MSGLLSIIRELLLLEQLPSTLYTRWTRSREFSCKICISFITLQNPIFTTLTSFRAHLNAQHGVNNLQLYYELHE